MYSEKVMDHFNNQETLEIENPAVSVPLVMQNAATS